MAEVVMDTPILASAVEILARLDSHETADALAKIDKIISALPSCNAPERLEAIAAALPLRVSAYAPELTLALAKLALELVHHRPRLPEDLEALPPVLHVAWWRVRLSTSEEPAEFAAIDDALLLRILTDWPHGLIDAAAPNQLLDRMTRAADPRLRAMALEQLAAALKHVAITPEQACACLLQLARDTEPALRRAAFEALRQRSGYRLTPAERRALITDGLEDARLDESCMRLAVTLDERELLMEFAFDEQREPSRRADALARLGELAQDGDLEPVLGFMQIDPLLYGQSVRVFILSAHQRGVFIHDAEIPALLDAYDRKNRWTGDELVRVAYVARRAMLAELARLPADDPRWIRRAAILAASVDTEAHVVIATQLRATTDLRIAAALLDAAGRSPDFCDEEALLTWLPKLPEPVIAALYAKGTERSVAPLRELVLDRRCPADLRTSAMRTLWALCTDRRALLRELSQRIGPSAAGLLDSTRLSARDGTAAQILVELGSDHDIEPLAALKLLCEAGKPELLPEITRLFRIVYSECVNTALAGDFTIKRTQLPELEQLIFRYGRHLIADGRRVRRWIEDSPETGDALVLDLAIDWLDEDPPAPICVALLETIARKQPTGAALRKIQRHWRRGEVEVKRAALEAILASESDEHGLTLSIGRLATAKDAKIVRQALLGIGILGARWAEPLVLLGLARPKMLIKIQAAATLAAIGSSRCIPALVHWLGIHDNSEFRRELLRALRAVAGDGSLAILVEALAVAEDRRERELLREATKGLLTMRAAVRLARSPHAAHRELIEQALAGKLELADGEPEDLAAALHRHKLWPSTRKTDPLERLRLEGFSPAAALAVLERRSELWERDLLGLVRRGFAEWLQWISGDQAPPEPSRLEVLELLLKVCAAEHGIHIPALLEHVERTRASIRPELVVAFLEQRLAAPERSIALRARAIALLRQLPSSPEVGGLRRHELLGKLGAVHSRADLVRCLADCRIGPNLARESEALLTRALAIPVAQADERERLDANTFAELERLREDAKNWYRMDERSAERWLDRQLETRPLDLPGIPPWPWQAYVSKRPDFVPESLAELHALLQILEGNGPPTRRSRESREDAAGWIMVWPETQFIADSWARVLALYLADEIDLAEGALASLAATLTRWPAGPWAKLEPIFDALDVHQRRQFLPSWVASWERAEPDAETLLRALDQELLIPVVRARAERGDFVMLRLLRPTESIALRELVEFVGARAPEEIAHLITATKPAHDPAKIVDPIGGKQFDELVALISERSTEVGLAVRAVHRLVEFGAKAGDALVSLTRDRRPRVRSAAFRELRSVVSHERRLAAAVEMLEIETRRDVIISLLDTITHGHYEPGFPRVLEYLTDRDDKLRDAAEHAVLSWGPEAETLLRRAARKARPDRRRVYEELLAKLESAS
jgi:hypothetical protein